MGVSEPEPERPPKPIVDKDGCTVEVINKVVSVYDANGNIVPNRPNDTTKGVYKNTRWYIVRSDGGTFPIHYNGKLVDTNIVWSDFSISRYNEQLFLDLGIAVSLVNQEPAATDLGTNPLYNGFVSHGALLSSSMVFADENHQWLSGLSDNDNSAITNWIRSGAQHSNEAGLFTGRTDEISLSEPFLDDDYYRVYIDEVHSSSSKLSIDKEEQYEDVVSGLWSPYGLVSTMPYHPGFNFSYYMPSQKIIDSMQALVPGRRGYNEFRPSKIISYKRRLMNYAANQSLFYNDLSQLPSVRIVFTADTTKWTCP